MASASIQKLERLLECSVCLEKFTDPKAFECLHFVCQPCINYMKPTTEEKVIGYTCPVCRQFTAKEKIRPAHFMHELLEVVEEGKREHRQCVMCNAAVAKVQCIDCKEIYCSNCHQQHNRIPMLQNHKWESLDESAVSVTDKHVYCTKHPDEQVKFHCKDCNELICIICNGTEHKLHTAETIKEVVDRAVLEEKRHSEHVKQRIEQNKEALEKASSYVDKIEMEYAGIEKEVDAKYDEVIKKADTDRQEIREQLVTNKDKQINEIKEWMKQTEIEIKSQENVLSLSDATQNTAKHTSLLQALKSGVKQGIEVHIKENTKQPNLDHGLEIEFNAAFTSKGNYIGCVRERSIKTQPLFIEHSLTKLIDSHPERMIEIKSYSRYSRFSKIDNRLWCIKNGSNEIHVYDNELKFIKTIKFENIGKCKSVAKVDSGIVVATDTGLYQSCMDGSDTRNIVKGATVDACWNGEVCFALDEDAGKIHVIKYDKNNPNQFAKEKDIELSQYAPGTDNTIQFSNGFIYIAHRSANRILQYTQDGELVSSHGTRGKAMGQIKIPRLCGTDNEGSLLIADCSNHRFQVLTKEGVWHIMKMNKVQYPFCAVIEDDVIYVSGCSQWQSMYISKYSLK